MKGYLTVDEHGHVTRAQVMIDEAPAPEGAIPVDPNLVQEYRTWVWLDGAWYPRPSLPEPVLVGRQLTWDLPEGSVITIDDVEVGDMIGQTTETDILFEDPGVFYLEVEPPTPWLRIATTIEVL